MTDSIKKIDGVEVITLPFSIPTHIDYRALRLAEIQADLKYIEEGLNHLLVNNPNSEVAQLALILSRLTGVVKSCQIVL